MDFQIIKFDGTVRSVGEKHHRGLKALLLKTGKFIEVESGELINIADIRSLSPAPPKKKYTYLN